MVVGVPVISVLSTVPLILIRKLADVLCTRNSCPMFKKSPSLEVSFIFAKALAESFILKLLNLLAIRRNFHVDARYFLHHHRNLGSFKLTFFRLNHRTMGSVITKFYFLLITNELRYY